MAAANATLLDQLLMKLIAVNGAALPPESYLNFLTAMGGSAVDNPSFAVGGTIVGSTDVTLGGSAPVDVAVTTAGGASAAALPAGAKVWRVVVNVTTAFNVGTLSVGHAGAPGLLLSGFDLTLHRLLAIDMLVAWGGTALPVIATITGSPSSGVAEVLVVGGPVQT